MLFQSEALALVASSLRGRGAIIEHSTARFILMVVRPIDSMPLAPGNDVFLGVKALRVIILLLYADVAYRAISASPQPTAPCRESATGERTAAIWAMGARFRALTKMIMRRWNNHGCQRNIDVDGSNGLAISMRHRPSAPKWRRRRR